MLIAFPVCYKCLLSMPLVRESYFQLGSWVLMRRAAEVGPTTEVHRECTIPIRYRECSSTIYIIINIHSMLIMIHMSKFILQGHSWHWKYLICAKQEFVFLTNHQYLVIIQLNLQRKSAFPLHCIVS